MGKTKKTKRETKKRKKTQRGGRPKFIKMYAQYTEDGNVIYRFVNDEFDIDDQKKIAEQDRVYYSVKNDKSLMDELKNQVGVLNEEVQSFFYKNPKIENRKTDKKIIIIRNKKELEQIQIAQKIIKNMNSIPYHLMEQYFYYIENNITDITDIQKFINSYKSLITYLIKHHKDILFKNIDESIAKQLLNTSTFIIGMHYNLIINKLNLDELKQKLDLDRENAEKERLDREKAEKDRLDKENAEKDKLDREKAEKDRLDEKKRLDKLNREANKDRTDEYDKIREGYKYKLDSEKANNNTLDKLNREANKDRTDEYDKIRKGYKDSKKDIIKEGNKI